MRIIFPKYVVLAIKDAKIEYFLYFNLTFGQNGRIIIISYTTENISDIGYIVFHRKSLST